MSMKDWSTTPASNATVGSISWAEGMPPSQVNDSARQEMADVRYELATQDTIASASTTDLGSKDAGSLTVSGTTTITSFGTVSAGIRKLLTFSGALTLTHNGTSLILPGAANITTVAGDSCVAESLGSGNWKVHSYQAATVTGTGATVRATSPTLVTPALGTPSSGNLSNCTAYPGTSALVTTGALNSGSITSGFGSIDVGADAISGGTITGSAFVPSGSSVPTNGIYLPASNQVAIANNSAESLRVDASGNLCLGVNAATFGSRLRVKGSGATSGTYCLQTANSAGDELFSYTNDGAMYVGSASASPYNNTTASAANAFIASSGLLQRSTSSERFKRDIEPMSESAMQKILSAEPIWYRSMCANDDPDWSWYGLSAEKLAKIDPRFVHFRREIVGWKPAVTKEVEIDVPVMNEEIIYSIEVNEGKAIQVPKVEMRPVFDELPLFDKDGNPVMSENNEQKTIKVQRMKKTTVIEEVSKKEPIYGDLIPDGVQYERLVVPLLGVIKKLEARLSALEAA